MQQRRLRDRDVRVVQPVRGELLRQQEPPRNVHFLVVGVACVFWELDRKGGGEGGRTG